MEGHQATLEKGRFKGQAYGLDAEKYSFSSTACSC